MTIRSLALLLAFALTPSAICQAQRPTQLGFVAHSRLAIPTQPAAPLHLRLAGSASQSSVWTWTLIGALAGGAAAGIWAGVEIAHSDDPMLAGPMLGIAIGGGAIVGGLAGALTYALIHQPPPSQ